MKSKNNKIEFSDICDCRDCGMTCEYVFKNTSYTFTKCPICESENIEFTHVDELGGTHSEGLGWNPNGDFCGECGNMTCDDCSTWIEQNLTCKDCNFSQIGFFTESRLYCGILDMEKLVEVDFNGKCPMFKKEM